MNKTGKNILIFFGVVGAIYLGYKMSYPTYSWNQKLTVEVETPDGIVSGSSVVEASVEFTPRIGSIGGAFSSWHGEATIAALPNGKYLFVLLGKPVAMAEVSFKETIQGDKDARIPDIKRYYSKLEDLRESAPLAKDWYPLFVTFDDLDDPATVKRVDPDNLAATFGQGYALKAVTLEISDEEVIQGEVEKVLKWINSTEVLKNPVWRNLSTLSQKAILGLKNPIGEK